MAYVEHFSVTKEQFESEIEKLLDKGEWRIIKISERLGYSQVTLSKFSHIYFGMTLNHFIHEKRMNLGRKMICAGGCSVGSVASKLGITRHHFSREYVKLFGVRAANEIPG